MKKDEVMIKREDVTTLRNDQGLGWKQTEGRRDNTGEETEDTGLSLSSHRKDRGRLLLRTKRALTWEKADRVLSSFVSDSLEFLHRFPTEIQK